ncbi:hypothetical protein CL620_03380 [archaeon]|nr:hypothetical protein [archaeon]
MKLSTNEDLSNKLDEDLAWRKKELTFVMGNLRGASSEQIKLYFLRIAVTLLYAHWEGYIKNSTIFYLNYIKQKRLNLCDLKINLLTLAINNEISKYTQSKKISLRSTLVNILTENLEIEASIPDKKAVSTQSNLKFEVLKEFVFVLGLDFTPFELKQRLIDANLLKIRNDVSHGNYMPIDEDDFLYCYSEVVKLLENFKEQIINSAINKNYLKVTI